MIVVPGREVEDRRDNNKYLKLFHFVDFSKDRVFVSRALYAVLSPFCIPSSYANNA